VKSPTREQRSYSGGLFAKDEKARHGAGQETFGLVLAMFEVPSPEAYKHRLSVVTSYYARAKLTVSLDR